MSTFSIIRMHLIFLLSSKETSVENRIYEMQQDCTRNFLIKKTDFLDNSTAKADR